MPEEDDGSSFSDLQCISNLCPQCFKSIDIFFHLFVITVKYVWGFSVFWTVYCYQMKNNFHFYADYTQCMYSVSKFHLNSDPLELGLNFCLLTVRTLLSLFNIENVINGKENRL